MARSSKTDSQHDGARSAGAPDSTAGSRPGRGAEGEAQRTSLHEESGPLRGELLAFLQEQIRRHWGTGIPEEVKRTMVARLDQLLAEERSRADARIKKSLRSMVVREKRRHEKILEMEAQAEEETFVRLGPSLRVQHIVLFASCIILIVTGLPLKFHDAPWAGFVFSIMGGVRGSGLVHRIAATGLIGVGLYHLGYVFLSAYGRWNFRQLLPGLKDFKDVIQQMKYYLGRSSKRARFARFSYVEKFDYWAVYWGMVVMILSGAMLWFEEISLRFAPKYVIDIAKEAHSDEALLATLAIVIWHFYNVHFNPDKFPMNRTWMTGKITKQEMMHEHPLEYEKLVSAGMEAGEKKREASEPD